MSAIDYRIDVRAQHHRFVVGHRVRLRISGGAASTLVPPREPVEVSIEAGPRSVLTLPGFGTD
jgi:predicted acyl esterase